MLPSAAIESAISVSFSITGNACRFAKLGRAHVHAIGFRGPVAHDVISDLAARRFDALVHFAGGNAEAFGDDLEMIDERFHLRLHFFAIRQDHVRRVGLIRTGRHPFQRLGDDLRALPHFL